MGSSSKFLQIPSLLELYGGPGLEDSGPEAAPRSFLIMDSAEEASGKSPDSVSEQLAGVSEREKQREH